MDAIITALIAKCAAYMRRFATRIENLKTETKDLEWRRNRIKIALGKRNRRRHDAQVYYDRHKDKPTKRASVTAALEEAKRAWREKYDELGVVHKAIQQNARKAENAKKSLATCQRKLGLYEREAEAQQKIAKSRQRIVAQRKEKILRRIRRDEEILAFVMSLQPSEIAGAGDARVRKLVTLCDRDPDDETNRDATFDAFITMHADATEDAPAEETDDLPDEVLRLAEELGIDPSDLTEREVLLSLISETQASQQA